MLCVSLPGLILGRGGAHLVECLPSIHEALSSETSVPHKPGMMVHSCNLSTWESRRQEDQMFNNAVVYVESEASQSCKRRKLAAQAFSTLLPIAYSQLLDLSFRAQGQGGCKLLLRGGKIPNEQHAPPTQPPPSATQPPYTLGISACWDINYHKAEVRGAH